MNGYKGDVPCDNRVFASLIDKRKENKKGRIQESEKIPAHGNENRIVFFVFFAPLCEK